MSTISKYIKVDKNILIEYIYNDGNLMSEPYHILVNSRDANNSYIAADTSISPNKKNNQLFRLDSFSNRYTQVDVDYYSFLQLKDYSSGLPIKHDKIRIHIPINWTFGEFYGFHIKVYAYGSDNKKTYDISNYYFNMTDVSHMEYLNYATPPLLFQEKLWGKYIELDIPSVSEIASQLKNNLVKENSINANLTDLNGLNLNSPIFIDFHFIEDIDVLNKRTSYILTPSVTTTVSQSPEYEKLGLMVKHSDNGDFFEIYGTYNGTISEFNKFINDSYYNNIMYYVQYEVTIYEQNIRGKSQTFTITDNFNETIEFRPIIKYSTTTAVIDVQMKLIDSVDDSQIIRRASYGMLQDELSKYSLNMMKINVSNVSKPKIYNIKNAVDPSLIGSVNSMGIDSSLIKLNNSGGMLNINGSPADASSLLSGVSGNQYAGFSNTPNNSVKVETIKVPYPVLVDKYNVIARSDNAVIGKNIFFGFSKIQIVLYPFDNVVKFSIATGDSNSPVYFDLTNMSEIKFIIKNDINQVSFPLYIESGDINLSIGQLSFKISENKFKEIKKIYESGLNVFYIVGSNQSVNSVIYSGLFKIYDTISNVSDMNTISNNFIASNPDIIQDNNVKKETATVTRKLINE